MAEGAEKKKRAHKKSNAGQKTKKKDKKKKEIGKVAKHNPKANTFSGGTKSVQKRVLYTLEKQMKKDRAPKFDKNPDIPPPFIVVVHGPPGCGKSTLIQSLVKHYAKQRLIEMRGPVTLVSGRQRRVTIVECPQEMGAMLDLAKIADLALLMIDASYGFELETFEFINILQVHGFPRVIGILTHLDAFTDSKQLRKVKKTMKHRFWTEIYEGSKLFYLSGLQYGRYHRVEMQNLARFIAVQKTPILSWRQAHPYMLALRWEDQTDPTAAESSARKLDLYGYVYGGRMREGSEVHLAGVGDFNIASIKQLPDPCPPPVETETERRKAAEQKKPGQDDKKQKKNALRTLAERHRVVYAPGSDIGSITVDSDAMYIYVPEQKEGFTAREGEEQNPNGKELPEAVRMVRALQNSDSALDTAAAARPSLRLIGNSRVQLPDKGPETTGPRRRRPVPPGGGPAALRGEEPDEDDNLSKAGAEDADDDDQEGSEEDSDNEGEEEEEMDDDNSDEDSAEAHKKGVAEKARRRFSQAPRLEDIVYGTGSGSGGSTGSREPVKSGKSSAGGISGVKVALKPTDHATVDLFDDDEEDGGGELTALKPKGRKDSKQLLGNLGDLDGTDSARMSALPGEGTKWDAERIEGLKGRKFITGGWSSAEEDDEDEGEGGVVEKKPKAKEEGEEGAEGEEAELAKASSGLPEGSKVGAFLEGFSDSMPIASFVRIRLEGVPAACVAEMKRERPVIVGGLLPGESRLGMMQVRVKRHRWHPKLLKSNDALLLSVGWRRFQTVPQYALEDRAEKRMRFLKYTIEHAHCTMTTWCPMVPPNSGVMAFRSWNKVAHFRVCATGVVLESAPNFEVKKKLKLVGEPYKIFKNTAFVRNMFNSDLEVNKYMHAKIQTVSGIRGEIKKAEGTKGQFRATFEDRILMSDLVVCKCWINVEPKKFYHPVVDVTDWRPARLIGELRAVKGVPVPNNKDSNYGKQLVRAERRFNKLHVPKSLEASLPYNARNKYKGKKKKSELQQKTAIVSSERDRSVNSLLQRLYTVKKEKAKVRAEAGERRKKQKAVQDKFLQDKRDAHSLETRKKRYIKEGQQETRKRKAMMMD
ncbi:unnamed protein product [Polarella glacialis]|uniref:Bms1-type G domain-containing protein n=1 Tax=Polarella glacialis TaxID=89957 RepID=A0A813I7U3_POLGL|nr:unnamed protein product [Polarella glacialis]